MRQTEQTKNSSHAELVSASPTPFWIVHIDGDSNLRRNDVRWENRKKNSHAELVSASPTPFRNEHIDGDSVRRGGFVGMTRLFFFLLCRSAVAAL